MTTAFPTGKYICWMSSVRYASRLCADRRRTAVGHLLPFVETAAPPIKRLLCSN